MYEFVKKGMLLGLGLAAVTREKFEETVEELIEKGGLSEKEGRELLSQMIDKSEDVRAEMTKRVEKLVAESLEKLNIPTGAALDELKDRMDRLEERLKEE